MTDIYIISGFLGAGKTTLLQKLLTECFDGKRVALVENDFGEISVDAALLKGSGYRVQELNSGCICCTLTGDFITALGSLMKSYEPDVVLIEPSGVGKLSDVEKACQSHALLPVARIARKITVVDVKRCESYLENFGEFFEDQVTHADTILLSRTQQFPERILEAKAMLAPLNPQADLVSEDWGTLSAKRLLEGAGQQPPAPAPHAHSHTADCACGCGHSHGDDSCCHSHTHGGHSAHEAFDTLTIRFSHPVSVPSVAQCLSKLEGPGYGAVLRAKGILCGPEGYLNLQFVPGDLKIEETDVKGNELCIIGRGLDEKTISALFAGV